MNIATFATEIPPFTQVEFEIYICGKRRKCSGIVQPSPRPLLGCVLIDYEVYVEPEFESRLVGDDCIYRGTVQLPSSQVKPLNLAGHKKDSTRLQPELDLSFDAATELDNALERVLGGDESLRTREDATTSGYVKKSAHGWIESHPVRRKRKSGDVWENQQYWLHWEEAGGKKRSRYIPKARLTDVEQSVYELKRPIQETLTLLEKRK